MVLARLGPGVCLPDQQLGRFGRAPPPGVQVQRPFERRDLLVGAQLGKGLAVWGNVVGGDGVMRFEMSPLGTSYGVYYAETVLQTLLALADVLEGRPAVAPAPPPPPQAA